MSHIPCCCIIYFVFILFIFYVRSELRMCRAHLLDIIADPNNEISTVTAQSEKYFSLLHGWIDSPDPNAAGASKLRHVIKFRWTNTLLGNATTYVLIIHVIFPPIAVMLYEFSMTDHSKLQY